MSTTRQPGRRPPVLPVAPVWAFFLAFGPGRSGCAGRALSIGGDA
jgi:hypothetical protein